MPSSDTFVSVVLAVHDRAEVIGPVVESISALLRERYANYEVVIVDDGSRDGTAAVLKGLLARIDCLRVLRLSRHFGRESALLAGLESSIGDYVVILSPGGDPPGLIPELVDQCRAGAGVVVGKPETTPARPWYGRLLSALFHAYARRVLRVELAEGGRTLFCLSRAALNAVLAVKSRVWHLRFLAGVVGFEGATLDYRPSPDSQERPGFAEELAEGLGIILSNSKHPLRFVSLLGLAASGLNLLYMCYVVVIYLIKPDVAAGWTTLSMQSSVMFFLVFVILTVLSEYVALVLEESQTRPAYFVAAELNSNVVLNEPGRRNIVTETG